MNTKNDEMRSQLMGNLSRLGWSLYEVSQVSFSGREVSPDYILLKDNDVYGFLYIRGGENDAAQLDEILFVNKEKPHLLLAADGGCYDLYRDGIYLGTVSTVPMAAEYDLLPENIPAPAEPTIYEKDIALLKTKINLLDAAISQYEILLALDQDGNQKEQLEQLNQKIIDMIPQNDKVIYSQLTQSIFEHTWEYLEEETREILTTSLYLLNRLKMFNRDNFTMVSRLLAAALESELRKKIFDRYLISLRDDPIDKGHNDPFDLREAAESNTALSGEKMVEILRNLAKKPPVAYSLRLIEQLHEEDWNPAALAEENFQMQLSSFLTGCQNHSGRNLSEEFIIQKFSDLSRLFSHLQGAHNIISS